MTGRIYRSKLAHKEQREAQAEQIAQDMIVRMESHFVDASELEFARLMKIVESAVSLRSQQARSDAGVE